MISGDLKSAQKNVQQGGDHRAKKLAKNKFGYFQKKLH